MLNCNVLPHPFFDSVDAGAALVSDAAAPSVEFEESPEEESPELPPVFFQIVSSFALSPDPEPELEPDPEPELELESDPDPEP